MRGGKENRKVDLVIARYKEKVSWLDTYKERGFHTIFIYNKSDTEFKCPTIDNKDTTCHVKSIPNVGVCDQTYLYHIVHHYNSLADVTIFAPGSAEASNKQPILDFTIEKAFETKNTVMNTFEFDVSVGEAMYNFTMSSYPTQHMDNRNDKIGESPHALADIRPFGAWYEANFPGIDVKKATFFGLMAVSREHIHQKPVEFYKKLLDQVSKNNFHEASHFMERAYTGIFHPIPDECMHKHSIIQDIIGINHGGYKNMRRIKGGTRKRRAIRRGTRRRKQKGGGLKFAVMAMFKNEAMGIREWIDHYLWQGVDTILLLDNNSTDNWKEVIQDVADRVTVLPAPKVHAQSENYNTIGVPWLKENGVDVLAIIDLDEYMFGTDGKNLKEHVVEIFGNEPRPSQVSCNWVMFGSSGLDQQPESIRKSFTWRKDGIDDHVKSILWLNDLVNGGADVHRSVVKGESIGCPGGIQLNHYLIQSKEFFGKVKMTRGASYTIEHENVRDWEYFKQYDYHHREDTLLKDLVTKVQSGGGDGNDI